MIIMNSIKILWILKNCLEFLRIHKIHNRQIILKYHNNNLWIIINKIKKNEQYKNEWNNLVMTLILDNNTIYYSYYNKL